MNTRTFLKTLSLGTTAVVAAPFSLFAAPSKIAENSELVHPLRVAIHRPIGNHSMAYITGYNINVLRENDWFWFYDFKQLKKHDIDYYLYKAISIVRASNDGTTILYFSSLQNGRQMLVYHPDENYRIETWRTT